MAPEETQSAGLSRLHLMEAMFHLDHAIEHLINLCNDEICDDVPGDSDYHGRDIRTSTLSSEHAEEYADRCSHQGPTNDRPESTERYLQTIHEHRVLSIQSHPGATHYGNIAEDRYKI